MDIRKYVTSFAVTFLILVLNGSFTNGIIELFKPSTEAQSSAATDIMPEIIIAFDVTMNILEIVRKIIEDNHNAAPEDTLVQMEQENWTDLDVIAEDIKAEVKVVNKDNLLTWDDDEKEQRAVRLIALLITKFLAFHDALQYSFYRYWVEPSDLDGSRNKAAYSIFLIAFGQLIETDDVISAVKVLLKSLTKYAEHSEVVDRTFNEIGEQMEKFERNVLENSRTLGMRKDDGRRGQTDPLVVKEEHVKFLLHAFADMLYEHKTWDKDTVKSEDFQRKITATYGIYMFTDLQTAAETIRDETDLFLPLVYLENTEHFLAYQLQTRDYLSFEEHNQMSVNTELKPLKTDIKNGRIVLTQRGPTVGQSAVSEPTVRRSPRLAALRQRQAQ